MNGLFLFIFIMIIFQLFGSIIYSIPGAGFLISGALLFYLFHSTNRRRKAFQERSSYQQSQQGPSSYQTNNSATPSSKDVIDAEYTEREVKE